MIAPRKLDEHGISLPDFLLGKSLHPISGGTRLRQGQRAQFGFVSGNLSGKMLGKNPRKQHCHIQVLQ